MPSFTVVQSTSCNTEQINNNTDKGEIIEVIKKISLVSHACHEKQFVITHVYIWTGIH